uniref:DUF4408 domain-containing protein n=1 Tax=Kalanchoe fedtschenkoi TaxID=63787 RepID=A0A7N0TDN4_KALFE
MESFQASALKVEKAYAKLRHNKLGCLFRVVEVSLVMVFVWRNSPQLPLTTVKFTFTGESFHGFFLTLSSPRIVFLIGNAIVLILFAESRHCLSSDNKSKPKPDYCDEHIQHKHDDGRKEICAEEKIIRADFAVPESQKLRGYKRSQSEMCGKAARKRRAELRRSATENCRQLICAGKVAEKEEELDKGMSDDEFRDMVEAFIARQQRNLRQE